MFIQQLALAMMSWATISTVSLLAEEMPVIDLTRADAMALARLRATDIQAVGFSIQAAQSRLQQAETWAYNPEISLSTGLRRRSGNTDWDRGIDISQTLDIGQRRQARIAIAQSGIEKSTAAYDEMIRLTVQSVAEAHLRACYMNERITLAQEAYELSQRLHETARQRHAAGAASRVGQTRAQIAELGALLALENAQADAVGAVSQLRSVLLIPQTQRIRVSEAVAYVVSFSATDEHISQAVQQRPALHILQANISEAEALVAAASASGGAQYTVRVGYEEEEDASIGTIGIGISVPLFNRNNGERSARTAASMALRRQFVGKKIELFNEITAAQSRYQRLHAAVQTAVQTASTAIENQAQMSRARYESGAIDIDTVLTMHRDIIEAQRALVDMRYRAARAGITFAAAAMRGSFAPSAKTITSDHIQSFPIINIQEY